MAFPSDFLDELTSRTDIVELVSGYVNLQRRGNSMLGLCPFHTEKTPSFSVSPDKQLYYCFGCGAGGGGIQFIMQAENMDFAEAVAFLADRAGLRIPEENEDSSGRMLRERLYALHVEAARFYHRVLTEGGNPDAESYLKGRGLSPATTRRFGLGAAPSYGGASGSLIEAMGALGYSKSELLAGGLASQNSKGEVFDRFRGRLMFPILDVRKRVIAFGGRLLGDGQPKYLNSPDTAVFSKSRNLFALNFAKNSKHKGLILAEGYMDVISLHQAGFDHAVASLGTALTEQQVQLIRKYADEVILAYDSDAAGRKASQRAAGLLGKADIKVSVLVLEGAKDPDEYIRSFGSASLAARLQKRESHVEHRITQIAASFDLNDDQGRVGFLRDSAQFLAGLPGDIERDVYAGRVAALAGVSHEAVRRDVKRLRAAAFKRMKRKEEQQVRGELRRTAPPGVRSEGYQAARAEEELIKLALHDQDMMSGIADSLTAEDFSTPFLGRIWEQMVYYHQNGAQVTLAALSQTLSPEEVAHLSGVLHRPMVNTQTRQALDDCLGIIRRESAARAAAALGEDPVLARALQKLEKKGAAGSRYGG